MNLSFKTSMLLLRLCAITLAVAILCLVFMSFVVSARYPAEIWKQLGITQQQGAEKIRSSFMNGYLDHYGIRNARNILSGNRASAARDLLAYTKTYLNSPGLIAEYNKERAAAKPIPPVVIVPDKESIRKSKIAELQKTIKGAEETIKKMPSMEKSLRPTIDLLSKTCKEYENPSNKFVEAYYQQAVNDQARAKDRYAEDLIKWEKNFPANPKQRLKGYLQEYLAIGSMVDFNARLEEKDGRMKFVEPSYERKSAEWKMIFRAGKEVYDVCRPFAEEWLSELR